jgi:predicted RND superfamily exporter protein
MPLNKRRFQLLLVYALCLLPVVADGARQSLRTNANSPLDWVPASFRPRQEYEQFRRAFGSGEVLIASWPGCTVDAPALELLTRSLRRPEFFRTENGKPCIDHVVTGQDALAGLMAPPLRLPRAEALARLQGTLVGPDSETTCAVITLTPAGLADRGRVVDMIRAGLAQHCQVPMESQHLAGPVIDGLSVDRASHTALDRFAVPSAICVFLLCWWCLKWLPGALLVFGLSLYCEGATLALIHLAGDQMSALLIVLPPLIQVVTVSGGIHLINYYLDARKSLGPEEAAWSALRIGWLPCTLAAATTAIGLGSLVVSQLAPIRSFGAYGAIGTLLTLGVVLAFLPGTLAAWKPKSLGAAAHDAEAGDDRHPAWDWLSGAVLRYHLLIVLGSVLIMGAAGWGIPWLTTSVHIETLFGHNSRILRDYAWIEEHVGPLVPVEVIVDFRRDCRLSQADRLEMVERVQHELRGVEHVHSTMSCVNFMPTVPADVDRASAEYRDYLQDFLTEARSYFVAHRYLHETPEAQQWRVTALTSALGNIDYADVLATIRRRITQGGAVASGSAGIACRVTGVMPLVHEIQRALKRDLFTSFVSDFAMITIVMTIAQGGILTGLISMVSNFFPTVLMFGILGWLAMPLDIGSVMTASVALGIAIDDTFHYLTFFRRGLELGQSRRDAAHAAHQHCGLAMVQSSLICGLGMMVFYFSDFLPSSRFAWMLLALLMVGLAANLVLLPALVVGPLGKLFEAQYPRPKAANVPQPARRVEDRAAA